jgi:hypothetical protein
MGQQLLGPTSVEGWMGGDDWISTGSMVQRINFASDTIGNPDKRGIKAIIGRIADRHPSGNVDPEALVEDCLDLVGRLRVEDGTQEGLVEFVREQGDVDPATEDGAGKITSLLQLIVSTREYQLA